MSGLAESPLVETAIGLVLVWFTASTLCAGIVEVVGAMCGFRAKHLWRGLERALGKPSVAVGQAVAEAARLARSTEPVSGATIRTFVDHLPGVTVATRKRVRYVGSGAAAEALVATFRASPAEFEATQLGALVKRLPEVKGDVEKLRGWFEKWFDSEMDTLTVTYRKNVRWWAALVALVVVPLLGLDSIGLATRLYRQPAERTFLQAQADDLFGTEAPFSCADGSVEERVTCSRDAAAKLSGLRVSAYQVPAKDRGPAYRFLLGFAVTFAAVTAGAPFWFGALQRLTGLKTSYKK